MVHERQADSSCRAAFNATYAQYLALKSIYEKSQYMMGGKLFSSRTVLELAQDL